MNNAFENEKEEKLSSTLEYFIRTLVWMSVYLYILKAMYPSARDR